MFYRKIRARFSKKMKFDFRKTMAFMTPELGF